MTDKIVYIYLDPRKSGDFNYEGLKFYYEPFYVGKGYEWRRFHHTYIASKLNGYSSSRKLNRIRGILNSGLSPIIIVIDRNLTDNQSSQLEIEIINKIGRYDLNKGPLLNLTNGGESTSGYKVSDETKLKIGNRRYPTGPDHHNFGKSMSEHIRQSFDRTGTTQSVETRLKISESCKSMWTDKFRNQVINSRIEAKARQLGFESDIQSVFKINELRSQGLSHYDISQNLNCSINYVRYRCLDSATLNPRYYHLLPNNG